jgi:HEPN domain-containing protein
LKALLVSRDIPFPKTHDLRRLLDLVRTHMGLDLVARTVLPLNRYTIEGRYPGDWEPINRQEAEEAVAIARHVREKVRESLPQQALNDEI